jgi:poly(hydroxyalkanoate) depolymerase family esterase
MAGLSETLATLARYRHTLEAAVGSETVLTEVSDFGANPGNLRMFLTLPPRRAEGAPLVVALHGCTQTAASFDAGSGWSALAARWGFAVLFAEQQRSNNAGGCFNWFEAEDIGRGLGEAASVRAMIAHALSAHGLDRGRVYVTGLSAGGAFANVMLAAYPEVFAGGAIVAGLPYRAALSLPAAIETMRNGVRHTPAEWGGLVRGASDYQGPWPRVSVWHGERDTTVAPQNGRATAEQWCDVHGLAGITPAQTLEGPATRLAWRGADGAAAVTLYSVPGLGHAVPLAAGGRPERCGTVGPFSVEAGVSSSYVSARDWGLAGPESAQAPAGRLEAAVPKPVAGLAAVLQRAFKAAGLAD